VTALPTGFRAYVANVGIKDATDDFVLIATDAPCTSLGMFTTSSFAGPSVLVSREHLSSPTAQAVVVISKNANVATGVDGLANAREVVSGVATAIGCDVTDVLIASTGVIGRQYPMDRLRAGLEAIPSTLPCGEAESVAAGIMTTDTVPKIAEASVGAARIVGVAKGVGMIEPNMATMITIILTDADVESDDLEPIFRRVVDHTFNCVSIDTDTSTSDTAIVMASGSAGRVDLDAFERGLYEVAASLTKQVARDGEGAEKLIEVTVEQASTPSQARRVAKAIVNSPLVKTAVHGADPNWGRVAMAIGKSTTADEVDQSKVTIRFGDQEVYPSSVDDSGLDALATYMRGDEICITATLAAGESSATVWGCDLTDGYVRINSDYTT
jgi:glutamate N-acetyltransferase / amino-acid N-acetyltransferase